MKKLITFGLSAATILSMTGGALMPVAGALTVAELQAQIAALTAQIAALGGSSSTSTTTCYAFTVDLTEGSTGPDVTTLQNYLQGTGHFTFAGGATGYFGSVTKAAVAAWQAANGVAPAYGYFGPVSRAKYTSLCAVTVPPAEEEDDDFSGTAEGNLENEDQVGSISAEEVGEGEEDVEVFGVDFEADGADQRIERVNVVVDTPTAAADSDDLEDYISDMSLWLDGEELGRMDVEDASYERADDTYTFRFTGLEGLVEDGADAELRIAVSGVNSLDGTLEGDGWRVLLDADAIRAASPNGATDTYFDAMHEHFTVNTFGETNDVELHASRSDENPEEQTQVGQNDDNFAADLLAFDLEATGSDIVVYGLTIDLTGTANEWALVDSLTLTCGEDSWDENVADDGHGAPGNHTDFGDIELSIDEDDTATCVVSADMTAIDGGDFDEGEVLSADLIVATIDAEDSTGEAVADLSGSANGFDQTFVSEGVSVAADEQDDPTVTFSADEAGETDRGKFIIEFEVTANDTEVWLDKSTETSATSDVAAPGNGQGNAKEGIVYEIHASGGANVAASSALFECVSDCGSAADDSATDFYIDEGDTETYRLTVNVTGNAAATESYKVWIDSINWDDADDTGANFYTSNLGEGSILSTVYLPLEDM